MNLLFNYEIFHGLAAVKGTRPLLKLEECESEQVPRFNYFVIFFNNGVQYLNRHLPLLKFSQKSGSLHSEIN